MRRINKKGALELSINAIVILILAITMLGLGLTFIRGIFKQISAKVDAAVDANELSNPPTRDNPLTAAPSVITMRTNDRAKVVLAFMNTLPNSQYCQLYVFSSGGARVSTGIIYNDDPTSAVMKSDQINAWTLSISGLAAGTYVYSLEMCCQKEALATFNPALVNIFTATNVCTNEVLVPATPPPPTLTVERNLFKKDITITVKS